MTEDTKKLLAKAHSHSAQRAMDRRDAMRLLSTLGGAALGTLVLPVRWDAPRLEFGVLSAHADCSAKQPACTFPCAAPSCNTNYASLSRAFSADAQATAQFQVALEGLFDGALFQVTLDRSTRVVTVAALIRNPANFIDSASVGAVNNGVLTFTWSPGMPPVIVNGQSVDQGSCTGLSTHWTLDLSIAFDGNQTYTLNLRNLTTPLCSYN